MTAFRDLLAADAEMLRRMPSYRSPQPDNVTQLKEKYYE